MKKPLLNLPGDAFPGGFPAGKHPLIVSSGYSGDIRMKALNAVDLYIESLMQGYIIAPFVDYLEDGKSAFGMPINYYIGGTNGQNLAAIVPCMKRPLFPLG